MRFSSPKIEKFWILAMLIIKLFSVCVYSQSREPRLAAMFDQPRGEIGGIQVLLGSAFKTYHGLLAPKSAPFAIRQLKRFLAQTHNRVFVI